MLFERFQSGIVEAVEHKSAKNTTATVVSITKTPRLSAQMQSVDGTQLYQICFTIDNFNQVEPDMRRRYESAETERTVKEGPRCQPTNTTAVATKLNKGDKIGITYLLENQYRIDIVRVTAIGGEL